MLKVVTKLNRYLHCVCESRVGQGAGVVTRVHHHGVVYGEDGHSGLEELSSNVTMLDHYLLLFLVENIFVFLCQSRTVLGRGTLVMRVSQGWEGLVVVPKLCV